MSFQAACDDMIVANIETFSDPDGVTYRAPGSTSTVTIAQAAWGVANPDAQIIADEQREMRREECLFLRAGNPQPVRNGTLSRTLTGESWTIVDVQPAGSVAWNVSVARAVSVDATRGMERRP